MRTSNSAHPLELLLGPFRYACGSQFARFDVVQNLGDLVRRAIDGAIDRSDGRLDERTIVGLRAAAKELTQSRGAAKRQAAIDVLRHMHASGLSVDFVDASLLATHKSLEQKPSKKINASPVTTSPMLSSPFRECGWKLNPRLVAALNSRGITTPEQVLAFIPKAYEDRRKSRRIASLRDGETAFFVATVKRCEETRGGGGRKKQFRVILADDSGSIAAVFYQTGAWQHARFPVGRRLIVTGEIRHTTHGWEVAHPEVEVADDSPGNSAHFNRIVPIYAGIDEFLQRSFRALVFRVVEQFAEHVPDDVPSEIRQRCQLIALNEALYSIHFPPSDADIDAWNAHRSPAHQRLSFDELFLLQVGLQARRRHIELEPAVVHVATPEAIARSLALLPFAPTAAQRRVVGEIAADMSSRMPMNRLLQGDVGSGKTAVAVVCAALATINKFQVAVMAPTDILAQQHYRTFFRIFDPLGHRVGLLTGTATAKERARIRQATADGEIQLLIGTHALVQSSTQFQNLGLAIIDEQHRFGVRQRLTLMTKGPSPDVLIMTATPIPRTLAMALYGDLKVSSLDEVPPGRTPIVTKVFHEKARSEVVKAVHAELKQGRQAYVVYPLVEESLKIDLRDATQGCAEWQAALPDMRVALVHGKMAADKKNEAMRAFRAHEIDVLIATTVIEVGVDVPNASVMVIDHSERFGLSQLHQLRGRVGRGAAASQCFLISAAPPRSRGAERLKVMESTTDGFEIAEKDLELRGPGEFLGTRQSGLPELAVANLMRDQLLVSWAQREAAQLLAADPKLEEANHRQLRSALAARWEGQLRLADVG